MDKRLAISILSALAFCLLVAGCSSGSGDSIDKAEFAKQAETTCKQASGRLAAEVQSDLANEPEKGFTPVRSRIAIIKQTLVPGLERELQELQELGVPAEARSEVQTFFHELKNVVKAAKADPNEFGEAASPYEAAELAGRRFGVSGCPIAPVAVPPTP